MKDTKKWLINATFVATFIVVVVFFLYKQTKDVQGTHDWIGQSFEIKVYTHTSIESSSEAYWERISNDGVERAGWAGWNEDEKYCELHVPHLRYVDDRFAIETGGHELWHCLIGTYHSE